MICPNCGNQTARLIIDKHGKACAHCRGLSEAAGVRVHGVLTRNADRVREQQRHHEGDMITPHIYDKSAKKFMPNPDFIKLYPEKIAVTYSKSELKQAGHSKVDKVFKDHAKQQAQHARDQAKGIRYIGDTGKPVKPPL